MAEAAQQVFQRRSAARQLGGCCGLAVLQIEDDDLWSSTMVAVQ
jgi:hypothetical protein